MKAVIQRVLKAEIDIDNSINRKMGQGIVIMLGVLKGDTVKQAEFLAKKVTELRIFSDENDKQNLSLLDVCGEILIVSNFTLSADCKKGKRPSYDMALNPKEAKQLYEYFIEQVKKQNVKNVITGEFGADMKVSLVNDGPITIVIDTNVIGK